MDGIQTKPQFQHSVWRIALIVTAFVAFILVCVFNGLASNGSNGRDLNENEWLKNIAVVQVCSFKEPDE